MKMIINYEWLCDFVPQLTQYSPDNIASSLTEIGAETEHLQICNYGSNTEIAEIINIEYINKLIKVILKVNNKTYTTISNSRKLEIGQFVIFAPIGTKLFNNFTVSVKNIENITTDGVLVALENIGIGQNSSDIILLGNDYDLAKEIFSIYTKDDAVITLDIPSNKSDWLSIYGLANALALYLDLPLPKFTFSYQVSSPTQFPININSSNCYQYSLTYISNIHQQKTPPLIQKRLYLLGLRPINLLVDLSNIVMLETGQPLHTFDANKVNGQIIIRQATAGEELTLLDGNTISLIVDDLIICDDHKILALAGVMGSLNSGVNKNTSEIYLESASFDNLTIRRTVKRLGLKTESSLRFEKKLPNSLVLLSNQLFYTKIIANLPNSIIHEVNLLSSQLDDPYIINLSPKKIREYLGINNISNEFIKKIILGLECKLNSNNDIWEIKSYRSDLQLNVDFYEEIARFYGYNNIPAKVYRPNNIKLNPEKTFDEKLRPLLRGMGLNEANTIAFRSVQQQEKFLIGNKNSVFIKNPLNIEWTEMRTHLFDGLLEVLIYNHHKAFTSNISFSEIAHTFYKKDNSLIEKEILSFVINHEDNPYSKGLNILDNILAYSKIDNIFVKNINTKEFPFLHPNNSFEIHIENEFLGFYGEVHPLIYNYCNLSDKNDFPSPTICELSYKLLESYSSRKHNVVSISELPPILRDITLTISEHMLGQELWIILKNKCPYLNDIQYLSIFQNSELKSFGKKNISLQLIFDSIEDIDVINQFINLLLQEYNKNS